LRCFACGEMRQRGLWVLLLLLGMAQLAVLVAQEDGRGERTAGVALGPSRELGRAEAAGGAGAAISRWSPALDCLPWKS